MTLESRWIGPAPAGTPTIVMLDDASASARAWGEFPVLLARTTGCGVAVCSRAGSDVSGPVTRPSPTTPGTLEAVSRVLDAIGFARGILLGHGEGASVATIYAGGREDHRVRGLVLIAPLFFDGDWDIRESIGYIRVPILIVRGTLDRQCTTAQIDAALDEAYCPVDVVLLDGAGHAPHVERPDDTLTAIGGFVSTLFTTFGEGRSSGGIRSEQPGQAHRV